MLEDFTPLHADPDEALRRSGVAFFLDAAGVRINVMLAETSFDATVIGRARPTEFQPGLAARLCSAEDLIICKSGSLRSQDRLDVEGIIRRQGAGWTTAMWKIGCAGSSKRWTTARGWLSTGGCGSEQPDGIRHRKSTDPPAHDGPTFICSSFFAITASGLVGQVRRILWG